MLADEPHGMDRDARMRVGRTGAHFRGHPNRLHDFFGRRTTFLSQFRMAANAIRTLRDVSGRDRDQLLPDF